MRFRHRILLFGLLAAVVTSLIGLALYGTLAGETQRHRVSERLDRESALLVRLLSADHGLWPGPVAPPEAHGPIQEAAHRFHDDLGVRVTLLDRDGRVVGDSELTDAEIAALESHAARPEIVAARAGGTGTDQRVSSTLRERMFYLARRIDRDRSPVGFVRLAVPVAEVERDIGRYTASLVAVTLAGLLVTTLLGFLAARRFSRPIEEMSRAAHAIAGGRRDVRVEYTRADELGDLGAALNRMTRTLGEQIDALSAEKRLRDTILDGMREGLLVVDPARRVLLGNRALRGILGDAAAGAVGRPLIELVRDTALLDAFDTALVRGEDRRETIRLSGAEGLPERVFEVGVTRLTDPAGAPLGAIGLFLDITRLSALEQVRRDFVADASHELRTPLTSIKAFVETLLAGGIDDASNNRHFLEIIRKHSDRMEALLDDLTDLSLIETGAAAIHPEEIALGALVGEVFETLRPRAEARRVRLVSEVDPGFVVLADRRRLEQILLNLVDNGVKFNKEAGSVTVRALSTGAPAAGVRIEVADTGAGIPRDAVGRIFNRFFRVDRARSREMGGTGLGLSIVKHLAQLHGGGVSVESEPGKGSVFRIDLPDRDGAAAV